MPWKSGGGTGIHVRKIETFGNLGPTDVGILTGHTDPIHDITFNPFYENLLASGSADSDIRIWDVAANDGQDLIDGKKDSEVVLQGHGKKI